MSRSTALGVGVGECLGYLLTGAWTVLVAIAMLQSSAFQAWLGWPAIIIGMCLIVGSLEFVGRFEEQGWKLAGALVPFGYTAWSLWLILARLVLLIGWAPRRPGLRRSDFAVAPNCEARRETLLAAG